MQRVVELKTEPVVGKRYLVPCVLDHDERVCRYGAFWVPVFGGVHEDLVLTGFAPHHLHIDWRFVGERLPVRSISLGRVYCLERKSERIDIVEKSRKCARTMPRYDTTFDSPYFKDKRTIQFLPKLEDAYASATVLNVGGCRTCPHRGLPLDGLPREEDGSVVCRGHGLCWAEDGTMLRRVEQKVGAT